MFDLSINCLNVSSRALSFIIDHFQGYNLNIIVFEFREILSYIGASTYVALDYRCFRVRGNYKFRSLFNGILTFVGYLMPGLF